MLLNLSNHPSSSWPNRQLREAVDIYGPIEDMAFPHIDPYATTAEVQLLAKQYLQKILVQLPTAVHLMGELTFTFTLATLLQKHGIECVASTTTRSSKDLPDGQKLSQFEFVQFRPYPSYE